MFHGKSLLTILVLLCRTKSFFKYTTIVQERLKYCPKWTVILKIMKIQVVNILCNSSHHINIIHEAKLDPTF